MGDLKRGWAQLFRRRISDTFALLVASIDRQGEYFPSPKESARCEAQSDNEDVCATRRRTGCQGGTVASHGPSFSNCSTPGTNASQDLPVPTAQFWEDDKYVHESRIPFHSRGQLHTPCPAQGLHRSRLPSAPLQGHHHPPVQWGHTVQACQALSPPTHRGRRDSEVWGCALGPKVAQPHPGGLPGPAPRTPDLGHSPKPSLWYAEVAGALLPVDKL